MAEILKEWTFNRMGSKGSWLDKYLNGQIWKLTSEDSPTNASLRSIQSQFSSRARKAGLKGSTQVVLNGKGDELYLIVQARKPTTGKED